ncbi:MAG: hypothetical protein IJN11_10315 [Oscillospiraceae bacterium]|nr:hypothetical protein [Ruminococcus sp.]MBQ6946352.1 hypothetical protein [Ruminococcus sp.]MBQ7003116.1 hypothetical protein [Oscillospiraceae bacterium]MBQ7014289.1 hypothetical protein [Oscillospiraceae bacterium]
MTAQEKIAAFLAADDEKLAEIIDKHPMQIPVPVLADLFGCHQDTLRTALQEQGLLGIAERKAGKLNRGFVVPTAHFVRWYMIQWRF